MFLKRQPLLATFIAKENLQKMFGTPPISFNQCPVGKHLNNIDLVGLIFLPLSWIPLMSTESHTILPSWAIISPLNKQRSLLGKKYYLDGQ